MRMFGNVEECQGCLGIFCRNNAKMIYSKKQMGMEDRKVRMYGLLGKVCIGIIGNT